MLYVISPDGSAWVDVKINRAGQMVIMIEEANTETHMLAMDNFAWVCTAIANNQVDENVNPEIAAMVVRAWNPDADPTMCCIERIVT